MRMKGMYAIVAGGTGGIGKAVAKALLAEGAAVEVWGRSGEQLLAVKDECSSDVLTTRKVDVMVYSQCEEAAEAFAAKYGRVDIMVQSVGGGHGCPIINCTPESVREELDYNLYTVFNCFRTVLPQMVKQQFGRLLYFSSTLGGTPNLGAYGMAKAGCKALMETISAEHIKDHITVNAIMPGVTLTPFSRKTFSGPEGEKQMEYSRQFLPLDFNTPENVARTAMNVLSDERMSGQIITLC